MSEAAVPFSFDNCFPKKGHGVFPFATSFAIFSAKGKTVEVGMAHFDTEAKRYSILDAPGHKNYVPNMIAGAAQVRRAGTIVSKHVQV